MYIFLLFISLISSFVLQAMTPAEFQGRTSDDFTKNKKIQRYVDAPIGDITCYTDESYLVRAPGEPTTYTLFNPGGEVIEFDNENKFVRRKKGDKELIQAAIDARNPQMVSALLYLRPQTLQVTLAPDQPLLIYAIKKALEPNLTEDETKYSTVIVKQLLTAGADPSVTYKDQSAIQLALQKSNSHLFGVFAKATGAPAAESLFQALEQGNCNGAERLLTERPERINVFNNRGETPLYVVLKRACTLLVHKEVAALSPNDKSIIGHFMTIAQILLSKFKSAIDPVSIKLLRQNSELLNLLSEDVRQRIQQQP